MWLTVVLLFTVMFPVIVPAQITHLGAHTGAIWDVTGTFLFTETMLPSDNNCAHINTIQPGGQHMQCLTCTHPALWWSASEGQPDQSPDGRWLVFLVRDPAIWFHACSTVAAGHGRDHDLWVMDLHSPPPHTLTRLHNITAGTGGSLVPKFSRDGTRLAWTDYEGEGSSVFGNWRLAVADFLPTPTPRLANIRYYDPVPDTNSFMEMQGWGPKDAWLYFACEGVSGQLVWGLDLCRMDLPSGTLTRLTQTSGQQGELQGYEEQAALSPDEHWLSYMSSFPVEHPADTEDWGSVFEGIERWQTDVWLMQTDGSAKQQVTFFSQPGHAHHTLVQPYVGGGKTVVVGQSWHPDGSKLAVAAQFFLHSGPPHMRDQLFLVEWP
jgi:Tol biopolymer transport system component